MSKLNTTQKISLGTITLCGLLLFSFTIVLAGENQADLVNHSPYSMDFYGYIEHAKIGDSLAVYDSQGTLCGKFTIIKDGQYGFLHVYGDDIGTTVDEGANKSEPLSFKLNDVSLVPVNGEAVLWIGDGQKQRVDFR